MRHPVDLGLLSAFVFVAFIAAICGYAIGWDHACAVNVASATSGVDHERSTARAICIQEAEWRDAMTVQCGRAMR